MSDSLGQFFGGRGIPRVAKKVVTRLDASPDSLRRGAQPKAPKRRRKAAASRGVAWLASELLEKKLALAYGGFTSGSNVTLAVSGGDHIYIQQVAKESQSLYYSNDSSFPVNNRVEIPDIDSFDTIRIINGAVIKDELATLRNAPLYNPPDSQVFSTRFLLSRGNLGTYSNLTFSSVPLTGSLSCIQPDGVKTTWEFQSNTVGYSSSRYDYTKLTITKGPGKTSPAPAGYLLPTDLQIRDQDYYWYYGDLLANKSSLEVIWSSPPTTLSRVTLESCEYGSWVDAAARFREPLAIGPSAPQSKAEFQLGATTTRSNGGLVDNSLYGTIELPQFGGSVGYRLLNGTLVFDDNPQVRRENTIGLIAKGGSVWMTVSGTVDLDTGVMSLSFRQYFEYSQLITTPNGDYREYYLGSTFDDIRLQEPGKVVVSATYGVYESSLNEKANSVTVFAGQDIDARLDIDLSGVGSTINVDSPVRMASSTTGELVLRATNINLNAPVRATNRLEIGSPSTNLSSSIARQGQALAQIGFQNGVQKVISIVPVPGYEGYGYDPDNPPTVTIGAPQSQRAEARVTGVSGSVVRIPVTTNGAGYNPNNPPRVSVQPPLSGVTATAIAIVDARGAIQDIQVTNGGSGYTFNPTVTVEEPPPPVGGQTVLPVQVVASTVVAGKITAVEVIRSGYGYDPAKPPVVTFQGGPSDTPVPATAVATVEANKITRITVLDGGNGYSLGEALVTVAEPPASVAGVVPTQATAEAMVDREGRITGYTITEGGSGYGAVPQVLVGSPLQLASAVNATVTVDKSGTVTGVSLPGSPVFRVKSAGSGYTSLSNVGITVKAPLSGGRSAKVEPVLDRGMILGVRVTDPGSGYLVGEQPEVTIKDYAGNGAGATGGSGATVECVVVAGSGYPVAAAKDPSGSSSYSSTSWVTLSPPRGQDGVQALLRAELDYESNGSGSRGIKKLTVEYGGKGYSSDPLLLPVLMVNMPVGSGSVPVMATQAELVRLNTEVEATNFEIYVADDPRTSRDRGELLITQTGSLSRLGGGVAADSAYIEASQADVYLEGAVVATKQSYLTNSPDTGSLYGRAPYSLTTTSPATGAQVGMVRGSTVSVTLGNGGPVPDASQDWISAHSVDLQTDIDSFRIRAANGVGQSIASAYPYELRVVDQGDITFDAVAASSRRIDLSAAGNIRFSSSLSTAGDLSIDAGGDFDVTAPISSTVGQISLRASNVIVNSTITVSAAALNSRRDDITITATQGDVLIQSAVKAINNVTVQQINRRDPTAAEYSNRTPLPITDNQTVRQTVTILDDFSFTDLNVAVDATHSFVSDLSLTLIAPDGTRVRLFASNGGSGDNLTGTVFDSEAAASIYEGSAPFTGAFRPVDPLTPLYGRSVRGTWTLEVRDGSSGDQGSLTNFTLRFANATPQEGRVAGNARIIADRLRLDVQGSVGNQSLPPTATSHFLRTKVNVVNADVGGNVSISDTDRLQVESMRTTGAVAIRAEGVDDVVAKSSALSGSLYDLSRLDIAVPNGSVDLLLNTSKTIVLGNGGAIAAGQSVVNSVAGSVSLKSVSSGFIVLDAPVAGGSARTVRFSPQQDLPGTYAAGVVGVQASTLSGTGDLNGLVGVPAGSQRLAIGDRILLQKQNQPRRNGVYTVTSLTTASWKLTRAADSDTFVEFREGTFVNVIEGLQRGMFQLSAGASEAVRFGKDRLRITPSAVQTSITSDDLLDTVVFVVSTTGRTNTAAGSLGKMLTLAQQNTTSIGSELRFASVLPGQAEGTAGLIRLSQELPLITAPLVIDASSRYAVPGVVGTTAKIVVDGSRIVTSRLGTVVTPTSEVNGFYFYGAGASQAVLAGLTVGGFDKGAAVKVSGATGVLLDKVVLGRTDTGSRPPSRYGVDIAKDGEATIIGSTIVGSLDAGIRIAADAIGATVVGSTLGTQSFTNTRAFWALGGTNRVGVDSLPTGVYRSETIAGTVRLRIPSSIAKSVLYPGQTLSGFGIASGTTIRAIDGLDMILSKPMTVSGSSTLTFGRPARNTISYNIKGLVLEGGKTTVTNSDIALNQDDGIMISGGLHEIGTSSPLGSNSNAIYANGKYGVNVEAKATPASQTIRNNYFGTLARATSGVANTLGNVAVDSAIAPAALGYNPTIAANAVTAKDRHGNQYSRPGAGTGGSGIPQPWRPQ